MQKLRAKNSHAYASLKQYLQRSCTLKVLELLIEEKNKFKDLACFCETLTNSRHWSGSCIIKFVLASLYVIGRFLPVSTPNWMQEISAKTYMS